MNKAGRGQPPGETSGETRAEYRAQTAQFWWRASGITDSCASLYRASAAPPPGLHNRPILSFSPTYPTVAVLSLALIVLLSYLLGAIPFSLVVARIRGVNLREHGSGNAGATNALRVMGKGPGLAVFALDFAKGLVAVVLISQIRVGGESLVGILGSRPDLADAWAATIAGASAMIGHVVTVWGRVFFESWKGGKGVATGAGMLAGLAPIPVTLAAVLFVAVVWATRYVSLGSILGAVSLPITLLALHFGLDVRNPPPVWIFAIVVPAFIVWTHRANVRRLLDGTESRFGSKA